ncbi:MAG: SDR family oxidoreductase [Aeromicrobium sp.]
MANIMVTGATGYIGQWLCSVLTANGHEVYALMRRSEQLESLQATCDSRGGRGSAIQPVIGNLDRPGLGLTVNPDVDIIFHLGAVFAWNLSPNQARSTNVQGSINVAELASQTGAKLVVVGGFMSQNATYLKEIGIDPLEPARANWDRIYAKVGAYEASKLESFFLTVDRADHLGVPSIGVHPATLCGHSKSGQISVGQPFTELIETIANERMSAIPGGRDHWLPLVTVDCLASLLAALADNPWPPTKSLIALDPATPDLATLAQRIASTLGVRSPRRRVPVGLLQALLRLPGAERLTHTSRESLSFIRKERFEISATRAFMEASGVVVPPIGTAIDATVRAIASQAAAKRVRTS